MDVDERLTALKKAYADIILNTAKEAAARIMASERKALRFEHELNLTKEQALQMLLRLKQTVDCKVSEAGMTYSSQERKIEELKAQLREAEDTVSEAEKKSSSQVRKTEELEAQLQEAEDIVKDLREELREVQAELERVRNSKLQHMDEHDTATQEQTSQENRFKSSESIIFPPPGLRLESSSASDMKNSAFNQRNEVYKCYNVNDYRIGNSYICRPDRPSTSEENRLNTSQSIIFPPPNSQLQSFTVSDMKNSAFNQRNEVYKSYSANDFRAENSCVRKPDLPAIILRNKGPEPYRNRRTQRIRAFEEKLMAGELSFSGTIDDVNYETSGRENGEGEEICKTPTHKADNMCNTEKKDVVQADSVCYDPVTVRPCRRRKRRAIRYKKNKTLSSKHLSNQALKRDQTSDLSCAVANSVNNNAQSGGDPSNVAPRLSADIPTHKADNMCSTEKKDVVQAGHSKHCHPVITYRRPKRRGTRYKKNKTPSSGHLSNQALERDQTSDLSCAVACSVNNNAQSGGDPSKVAPRLSADTTYRGTPLGCTEVIVSDAEFVKAVSVEIATNKDKASIDELLLTRQEIGSADSSGVPISGKDVEKVDMPVVNSQTKISGTNSGIPNQPVSDRVIKYTFQRKRKKESLISSDGNAPLEEEILKKKAAEKQNGPLEMEKSSSITESSRDSRRLAQVARQLISLSEKKWWQ